MRVLTAEQSLALRVFRENLAALLAAKGGRALTAAEANYRAVLERRIAELEGDRG